MYLTKVHKRLCQNVCSHWRWSKLQHQQFIYSTVLSKVKYCAFTPLHWLNEVIQGRLQVKVILTLIRLWAMVGVMFTQRVKQSRASESLPSRSSCRPLWRLVSLRLKGTWEADHQTKHVLKKDLWQHFIYSCVRAVTMWQQREQSQVQLCFFTKSNNEKEEFRMLSLLMFRYVFMKWKSAAFYIPFCTVTRNNVALLLLRNAALWINQLLSPFKEAQKTHDYCGWPILSVHLRSVC